MDVTDPRGRYDDHVVTHSREVLGPKPFEEAADSEAATIGWVVLAFVFDDEDRVLLVDEPWADGWTAPGGVLQSGESLAEAVVREVREETGVEASPIRSHASTNSTSRTSEPTRRPVGRRSSSGRMLTPRRSRLNWDSKGNGSTTPLGSKPSRTTCSIANSPKRCISGV